MVYRAVLQFFQKEREHQFNKLLSLFSPEQHSEMLPDLLEVDSHSPKVYAKEEIVKILTDLVLEERVSVVVVTASLLKGTTAETADEILEAVSKIKAEERIPLLVEALSSMKSLKDIDSRCFGMVGFLKLIVAHPEKETVAIIEQLIPLLKGVLHNSGEIDLIFEAFALIPFDHLLSVAPIFVKWLSDSDEEYRYRDLTLPNVIEYIDEKERIPMIELVHSLTSSGEIQCSYMKIIRILAPLSKDQRDFVLENKKSIFTTFVFENEIEFILEIVDRIPKAEKVVALDILLTIGCCLDSLETRGEDVLEAIDEIPSENIATALLYADRVCNL